MKITKIIHQIWSGIDGPLPEQFEILGQTWKRDYPDWKYELWDHDKMNQFILDYYPQYWDLYNKYPYNVQRWDVIRYLILYKIGGMYVDFDYESIEPMDKIIAGKYCCFSVETEYKDPGTGHDIYIHNNALMLSVPNHPYMKKIIEIVFSEKMVNHNPHPKDRCVLYTTGPMMLNNLYNSLEEDEKETVFLIPAKHVTPFNVRQAHRFRAGDLAQDLEDCLEEAYAVHYFFGGWLRTED